MISLQTVTLTSDLGQVQCIDAVNEMSREAIIQADRIISHQNPGDT